MAEASHEKEQNRPQMAGNLSGNYIGFASDSHRIHRGFTQDTGEIMRPRFSFSLL